MWTLAYVTTLSDYNLYRNPGYTASKSAPPRPKSGVFRLGITFPEALDRSYSPTNYFWIYTLPSTPDFELRASPTLTPTLRSDVTEGSGTRVPTTLSLWIFMSVSP